MNKNVQIMTEARLWRAVIGCAIHEWIFGPLRHKREAEKYLFGSNGDFILGCQLAGIDAKRLRAGLPRFRKLTLDLYA